MTSRTLWLSLLMAVLLVLPAGFAFSQDRMADITDAKALLDQNPTFNNRLRLATLQYLEGVDQLNAGNTSGAIDSMQAGVWTLEDGQGQVPEGHPVFEESRYGLAYALLQNDNPFEAQLVLDQAVSSSPGFGKARYLLGVTLLSIPGDKSTQRGLEVMTALAQDGDEPYNEWAAQAATRYGYNLSTLTHAAGDAAGAAELLSGVTAGVGEGMGASGGENNQVAFAMGVYLRDSGDTIGALNQLEAVYASDSGFQSGGVAASGVLANMYYASGLEQLQLGGDSANQLAAVMFDDSLRVGDSTALDAHHGRAVAYTLLGDNEKAVESLQAIVSRDPSYYERIKAK